LAAYFVEPGNNFSKRLFVSKLFPDWSYREGNQDKTTVVLGIPPVDSPHGAVLIAIASKAR
jgi:hypothetical protein